MKLDIRVQLDVGEQTLFIKALPNIPGIRHIVARPLDEQTLEALRAQVRESIRTAKERNVPAEFHATQLAETAMRALDSYQRIARGLVVL